MVYEDKPALSDILEILTLINPIDHLAFKASTCGHSGLIFFNKYSSHTSTLRSAETYFNANQCSYHLKWILSIYKTR